MVVTTINGVEIDKKHVRKIKSLSGELKYYKIGNINIKNSGDCYQINNIYYTIEKERIKWDNYLNQYALKTSLLYGIINSEYEQGYFSKNSPNIVSLYLNKEPISQYCISKEVALTLDLIEDNNNLFYNPHYYSYSDIIPRYPVDRSYKNSLPYNFKTILEDCKKDFLKYEINYNSIANNYYQKYKFLLNKYTFGIEIETIAGVIPDELCKKLGVRPLRDGSISGLEYVTVPLTGEKGIHAFIDIVNLINKYTSSDFTCSMHVHVGGVIRSMEFITAMFKTMYHIQDDIYNLFPVYKKYNTGVKRQCYTSPLDSHLMASLNYNCNTVKDIQDDYQKIVQVLSGNHNNFRNFVPLESINEHPSDPSENSKWNMKERYKILNLIPLIFTNKQTIEYRIYTVPDTIEKAVSFLMMSLIITDFVNKHQSVINSDQSIIKSYNLEKIYNNSFSDNDVNRLLVDRRFIVNDIINNKGGFFEEKDVKLNNKRYVKNMGQSFSQRLRDVSGELSFHIGEIPRNINDILNE